MSEVVLLVSWPYDFINARALHQARDFRRDHFDGWQAVDIELYNSNK